MKLCKFYGVTAKIALVALLVVSINVGPLEAQAASVTSLSDVMSRLKASTASNHEIKFVTPTGVAAGQTIILTFSSDFTNVTNIVHGDIDFAENSGSNCSAGSWTEKTLAASPSGATWGADGDSATTVTITSGTDTITAGRCVRIKIGTNATSQVSGSNQISNGAIDDDDTISISGTFGDTGTLSVDIITEDQVTITATVDPTITFTISDTAIGFGPLSSTTVCFANGTPPVACDTSDESAHNMTVATNAQSGYSVTYVGNTLTSGSNSICADALPLNAGDACGAVTNDADGSQGTEQFGMGFSTSGDATIASGYDHNATPGNRDWEFIHNTTTTIVSETGPTNTETISAYYLANIGGATEAGSYSTTVTFIATGTF